MQDFEDYRPNHRPKKSKDHLVRNIVIGGAGSLLILAAIFLFFFTSPKETDVETAQQNLEENESPTPIATPELTPEPTPEPIPNHLQDGNLHVLAFTISGALATSLREALPDDQKNLANILAERVAAALRWKLDPRRDMRSGDAAKIVYNPEATTTSVPLYGFWYRSKRLGKDLMYVYYPSQDGSGPAYFDAQGYSITDSMKSPPLKKEDMEKAKITPLGTKGLIFSIPRDTPIQMPFPARVLRLNWDLETLGRAVEVRYLDSGIVAQFCHLESISEKVKEGAIIGIDQPFATAGTTGNASYPQVLYITKKASDAGDLVDINPLEFHGQDRMQLPEADRVNFLVAWGKVEKLFLKLDQAMTKKPQD